MQTTKLFLTAALPLAGLLLRGRAR